MLFKYRIQAARLVILMQIRIRRCRSMATLMFLRKLWVSKYHV